MPCNTDDRAWILMLIFQQHAPRELGSQFNDSTGICGLLRSGNGSTQVRSLWSQAQKINQSATVTAGLNGAFSSLHRRSQAGTSFNIAVEAHCTIIDIAGVARSEEKP
jgi:hypothetical protein